MDDINSNIAFYLIKKFISSEFKKTILLIILSLTMSILTVNVISKITASIINAAQNAQIENIYKNLKYLIIVSILFLILYYIYKNVQAKLISQLRQWIKLEIIKILLTINNNNLSQINMPELYIPIIRISNASFQFYNLLMTVIIPNIILVLVIGGYFSYKNINYGVLFLISNIIIITTIYCRYHIIRDSNLKFENSILIDEKQMLEILNNFDRIIQRGSHSIEHNNYETTIKKTIDSSTNFYLTSYKEVFNIIILLYLTIFSNILYLIYLFSNKTIDIQIFITFFTIILIYREKLFYSIQSITDYAEFFGRAYSLLSYFKNMIRDYTNVINNNKKKNINIPFNTIIFDNVEFEYDKNKDQILHKSVLKKFNLTIPLNGLVGITGPSGKGKSTIGKLIIKLYKYQGKITIDNIDIQEIDNTFLRNKIIYIDQSSKFFDIKIIKNLLYGCDNNDEHCVSYFKNIRSNFPKINSIINNLDIENKMSGLHGNNLSGGQRQVVNIINGLIQKAQIILIDEPTNALDPELKKEIIQLISVYKKYKKAIIVITHDKDLMTILDKQIKI